MSRVERLKDPLLFTDIPQEDTLSYLIRRYSPHQPARDLFADQGHFDSDTNVQAKCDQLTNDKQWLALALYARAAIQATLHDEYILPLWVLRLASLQRLRLLALLLQELHGLLALLPPPYTSPLPPYRTPQSNEQRVSVFDSTFDTCFELVILHCRAPAFTGKHNDTLERLLEVYEGCKRELWSSTTDEERTKWQERAIGTGLHIVGVFLDQKDTPNALSFLKRLLVEFPESQRVQVAYERAHAVALPVPVAEETGQDADGSSKHLSEVILLQHLKQGAFKDIDDLLAQSENVSAVQKANTLAISSLLQGHVKEAYTVLDKLSTEQPRECFTSQALLCNFVAVLELSPVGPSANPEVPMWNKIRLMEQAARFAEPGLPNVFKL